MPQPESRTKTVKSPIYRLRGQNDQFYPSPTLSPENTEILERVNITETGSLRRTFGSSKFNSSANTGSKDVTALKQAIFANGQVRNIETAGTSVYTNDGTTRTAITGSLTLTDDADARFRSAFIKDSEVFSNASDEVFIVTNSGNATALSGVNFTTCQDVVVAKNLLIILAPTVGGVKQTTRIQWCDINTSTFELDITNWPTDSIYELYQGGNPIIGGVEFGGRLFVVKSDGIYPMRVTMDNGFIEVFADDERPPLRGEFTPIAKNSILSLPGFMFVIAQDGAYRINPDLTFDLVTEPIQETWNALSKSRLKFAHSWVRKNDHQIRTLLSSPNISVGHDKVLVYDYNTGDVWIEAAPQTSGVASSWTIVNEDFDMFGSIDGFTRKGNDDGQVDDDGEDIDWKIRGAANDLGYPGVTKNIVMLITYYKSKGGLQTIEHTIYRDDGLEKNRSGNLSLGTTLLYNIGNKHNSGLKYGGGTTAQRAFLVNRGCDTISPQWSGTQDFELIGYQVEFEITE
jgi:hypothetical protein